MVAMSTMDNASAQLAIALQLRDLDELEALEAVDKTVIRIQRQQLEIDSGFDAVTFEASRRLALSMARAVEDDGALLARSMRLPQIDDATFNRLAQLNHPTPKIENAVKPAPQRQSATVQTKKRTRSPTLEDEHAHLPHKKVRCEQSTSERSQIIQNDDSGVLSVQDSSHSTAPALNTQMVQETELTTSNDDVLNTADCVACSDNLSSDNLVKISCEHQYCKKCFGLFIEKSLQAFPPKCCSIPVAFLTVADNVSPAVFDRYRARQDEIKNATALYCGVRKCGVKIDDDMIEGTRAFCRACRRDTCTLCRGGFQRKVGAKEVVHFCKKDKAREQVLELAKQEGWQSCFNCGNLVELNFGCHHMRCRCKAEFCYRCGIKWKTCACGDYDEPRIETRAIEGLDIRARRRIKRGLPPDLRPRAEQLAELQQRLRTDCDHNDFFYEVRTEENPGYCRICEYPGWKYILRCESCRFTACRDCHTFFGWNGGEAPWEEQYYDQSDDELVSDDGKVSEDESI